VEGSSHAKTSSIHTAVSTEHRLVTDSQTDTESWYPRQHSVARLKTMKRFVESVAPGVPSCAIATPVDE